MPEGKRGWWDSSIIWTVPNELRFWGYAIEDLIGHVSYGEMVYLMIKGELPSPVAGRLMDAVLVAACDHGAVSPAVVASMMAATCGITLNSVIATGMNMLGHIHGGAVEDVMILLYDLAYMVDAGQDLDEVCLDTVRAYREKRQYLPGFGHPVHTRDPRVPRLFELVAEAAQAGVVSGRFVALAESLSRSLEQQRGKRIPLNVDAGVGVVLCELGMPAETAMGYICLSRGIGLLAHAYEEIRKGQRLKGPSPPAQLREEMTYSGPQPRSLPAEWR